MRAIGPLDERPPEGGESVGDVSYRWHCQIGRADGRGETIAPICWCPARVLTFSDGGMPIAARSAFESPSVSEHLRRQVFQSTGDGVQNME